MNLLLRKSVDFPLVPLPPSASEFPSSLGEEEEVGLLEVLLVVSEEPEQTFAQVLYVAVLIRQVFVDLDAAAFDPGIDSDQVLVAHAWVLGPEQVFC